MAFFYIAATVKQDRNDTIFTDRANKEYNPGYYSYVIKCADSDNIKSVLERIGGLQHANIYATKKRAAGIVNAWNAAYKTNGTFLYNNPAF